MKRALQHTTYSIQPAFTLIELLIAVSIFATISVVLYSCFRGGIISWRRVDSEGAFQQEIRHAMDMMSEDFKNMLFLSNLPFQGTAQETAFVTTTTLGGDTDINAGRVSYYLLPDEEDAASSILARRAETIKNALRTEESEEEESQDEKTRGADWLLEGILELKFSYLLATQIGNEPGEMEYEWLDFWDEDEALPMGIKVDILLSSKKEERSKRFSKRIWIPSGKPLKGLLQEASIRTKE